MEEASSSSGKNNMDTLGLKLREARQAQNLTLREIARRTGLTASLISQVERGLANPSVSSLYNMAEVLGLSMDYFFNVSGRNETPVQGTTADQPQNDPALTEGSPVLHAADRHIVNIAGGVQWQNLIPQNEQAVEFMELRYDVGSSSGELAYQHRGREYGVVLQGQLLVELGFNKYQLEPGDSISFDCTVPHRLINTGDIPVVGIWLVIDRY
jgi:transcriptional regulator with XRE-family HTH domain